MMRGRRILSVALVVAMAGCGAATPGSVGGGGNGGGQNGTQNGGGQGGSSTGGGTSSGGGGTSTGGGTASGGGGTATGGGTASGGGTSTGGGTLAVAGTYDVTTQFNLLDALPPDVETAFHLIIEFADSPGSFLLDMADRIPVVKYVIDAIDAIPSLRDKITMAIDNFINQWTGGVVTTMHGLATDLEMALRGLSMHSRLVVSAPDANGNVTVQDTLVDLSFTWNGKPHAYAQNAHGMATATLQGLQIKLPAHAYDRSLDFGGMLVDLLDNVALPELTGVNSLGALVNQLIDCSALADWVWGYIGNDCLGSTCISQLIGPKDIARLCTDGLNLAGDVAEAQLASLSAPGNLSAGDFACLAVENKGHTGHADSLTNGTWSLTIPAGSGAITLPGKLTGTLH